MKKNLSTEPPIFSGRELEILEAFLKCAAKSGVEAVTLQMVANEAKVAFGTVRYHFANKPYTLPEAAAFAIVREIQVFTQDFLHREKETDKHDGIRTHIRASFEWVAANPVKSKHLMYFYYLNAYNPKLPLRAYALFKVARDRFEALLHEGTGRGIYPRFENPKVLAERIHTLLIGGLTLAMMEPSQDVWEIHLNHTLGAASELMKMES